MPDILPSSPEGQALQAAIQAKLAQLGWCEEDDSVMAEYCLVMLGNRKTADQISAELSDLIGGDSFDPSFVTWVFDEVKKHYPEPAAPSAPSAASSSAPTGPAASSSRSGGSNGIPARPAGPIGGGRNVFGAAVTGVKRGAAELDGAGDRQGQRARFDAPTGPRAGAGGGGGGKGLFERAGGNNPQFAPGPRGPMNTTGMPQPAFDAITQAVTAIQNGAHPSILAQIPFPALAAHPLSQRLPPHIMAQAQANAMAQAQAMAAIQNVWNAPPGAFNPNGGAGAPARGGAPFNPNAPAFNPAFGGPGGPGGGAGGPPRGGPSGAGGAPRPSGPPVVLPSKPASEQICKHGVECTRPQCPYSHPSPVATKESGLVLSSDPCDKQLKCEDPDCPMSHVSKAQKTHPPSSTASSSPAPSRPPPAAAAAAAAASSPSSIAGAGIKPCKFGSACTRPNCVFRHPWDQPGPGGAGQQTCRYGAACTRPDCHFAHPSRRPAAYSRNQFSATFGTASSAGSPAPGAAAAKGKDQGTIGAWPSESKEHISERLKRFAGGDAAGGDKERIVPGGEGADGSGKDANGDDKVEINLDDDEEHHKKEAGKA
ncbi:hypothetical protein JCM9279_004197 [Rhodotorula babjevae]